MKLRAIAHARAGDKGNVSNIAVFVFDAAEAATVREFLTAERVADHFADLGVSRVTRYELPALAALNFVIEGALGGGVTRSLSLDAHGKALSSSLLEIELPP